MSVSFSGELAWEIHVPIEQSVRTFEILWDAGQKFGIKPFGLRATESMRIEKGYRHWKADLIAEFNPMESGLERFVNLDKDFVGKDSLVRMLEAGPRRTFVMLEVDCGDAIAHPGDAVLDDGAVRGTVTSAAWGHRTGKNLAMAFVDPPDAQSGDDLGVEILGHVYAARIVELCQYDPANERVKC